MNDSHYNFSMSNNRSNLRNLSLLKEGDKHFAQLRMVVKRKSYVKSKRRKVEIKYIPLSVSFGDCINPETGRIEHIESRSTGGEQIMTKISFNPDSDIYTITEFS